MAQHAEGSSESMPTSGIINTRVPRVVGDIGNPQTFPFPGATRSSSRRPSTRSRARAGLSAGLVAGFVDAAHRLAAPGVAGLTTSCHFVAICQAELARRCPLPMVTSSLCQVALIQAALPAAGWVGVNTADRRKPTPKAPEVGAIVLACANIAPYAPGAGPAPWPAGVRHPLLDWSRRSVGPPRFGMPGRHA